MKTTTRRRRLAGILAAASGLALGFLAPTPAMATGDDFMSVCQSPDTSCQNGVEVSGTIGPFDHCDTAGDLTEVCVRYDGDVVYVKDGETDSHSALGMINASSGVPTRICRNPYGSGTWARCDFDWEETAHKDVYGGEKVTYDSAAVGILWSFSAN
jgi:hypothetical protein